MVGQRILVATALPDNSDRRAEILARRLRDGGDEVIFTGPDQSVRHIVLTAIAEDAAAIGLPGADVKTRTAVTALLAEHGAADIELLDESEL